ncbi:MAG: amino acid adenylation domain-containing protein, partial [Cobetia crustatorum]
VIAPVVFACNLGTPLVDAPTKAVLGELHHMISQTPQVWLDHQVYDHEGGLLLVWDAVEDLFPTSLLDDMFSTYIHLIEWLAANPGEWGGKPRAVLPLPQASIRAQANATACALPPRLLQTPILAQGTAYPERVALIAGEQTLTFGELCARALSVAGELVAQGVLPGAPVAISLPRGPDQVVAALGILMAGGCYVPIGLRQPASRRAKIQRTAGIAHALCSQAHPPEREADDGVQYLEIEAARLHAPLVAPVTVDPASPAYIIFTSGSTGEPKGVQIAHQAAANTLDDINARCGITDTSRGLAVSALDFDLSVYDLFGLLGVGGSLVLIDDDHQRDAAHWVELVTHHQITVWNSVPVLLDMLLVAGEGRRLPLEQVLLSGDWIGLDLPERLAACSQARLFALGGATEASIWSNVCEVEHPIPADWISIPYGKPLANQQYRVVDTQGRDCPNWVAGELWIGGAGVADGYRGAPELTASCFVEWAGSRWYRTGDRGRYWPDGTLEFLGREDHQVKIRGHRIELGEIETALKAQPGVEHAIVVMVGTPAHLAAALVLDHAAGDEASFLAALTHSLEQALPDYMIPGHLLVLDELPLSANGKVDRVAISRHLQALSQESLSLESPRQGLETDIANTWQAVLNNDDIGRNQDFFALGGDSLSATRIVVALQQRFGKESLSLREFYASAPTIAALARHIESHAAVASTSPASSQTAQVLFEEGVL